MRNILPLALLSIALGAAPALAAQDSKVQTTSQANRESLPSAAQAPLRDLNVVRTNIPEILVQAMADPYARPKSSKCRELTRLIRPLDEALGADIDKPPTAEDQRMIDRSRGFALGAVASVASDAIPFRGIVRSLSGAAKHDQYVQSAILAGSVRRAYLKGLGEARGCKPPATPSHVLAGSKPPPVNAGVAVGLKPRYPIR
jgi:hypothetical protein